MIRWWFNIFKIELSLVLFFERWYLGVKELSAGVEFWFVSGSNLIDLLLMKLRVSLSVITYCFVDALSSVSFCLKSLLNLVIHHVFFMIELLQLPIISGLYFIICPLSFSFNSLFSIIYHAVFQILKSIFEVFRNELPLFLELSGLNFHHIFLLLLVPFQELFKLWL